MTRDTPACSKASRAAKRSRATRSWARIPPKCFATSTARACSKARAAFPGCNPIRSITCAIASSAIAPCACRACRRWSPARSAISPMTWCAWSSAFRTPTRDDVGMDDAVMMFFLGLVVFDHVRHRVWIVRNVFTDGEGSLRAKYNQAVREIRATRRRLDEPVAAEHPKRRRARPLKVTSNFTRARFLDAVRKVQGIHSRRRHFSGGHQPAVCRARPTPTRLRFTAPCAW